MRNSYQPFSPYPSVSDWWNLSSAPSGASLQEYLLESAPSGVTRMGEQSHVTRGMQVGDTNTFARREAPTHVLSGGEGNGIG